MSSPLTILSEALRKRIQQTGRLMIEKQEEVFAEGSSDEDESSRRREREEKYLKKRAGCVASKIKNQTEDEKPKLEVILPPHNLSRPAGASAILEIGECTNLMVVAKEGLGEEMEDAEKAYLDMAEKVEQLKKAFDDGQKFPSQLAKTTLGSHLSGNQLGCANSSGDMEISNLLSSDWDFLNESCDFNNALSNTKKLDILLDIVGRKEKEARDETLNVQQDIRQKLNDLCEKEGHVGGELAKNTAQFRKMCPSSGIQEENHGRKIVPNIDRADISQPESDEHPTIFPKESYVQKGAADHCGKGEGQQPLLSKWKTGAVKRNIELPADGRRMLAINDSEKQRIESLLSDILDEGKEINHAGKKGEGTVMDYRGAFSEIEEEPDNLEPESYALVHVKHNLQEIDDKIKEVCGHQNIVQCIGHCDEAERARKEFQEKERLFAINRLLTSFSQPSEKEVEPLAEEQIKSLVNTCKNNFQVPLLNNPKPMEKRNKPETPFDVQQQKMIVPGLVDDKIIKSLVQKAKSNMPLFKFRNSNGVEEM